MKPSTKVWARFESTGYPHSTMETGQVSMHEAMQQLIKWMLDTKMTYKISITFANEESKLIPGGKRTQQAETMTRFLDQLMNENPEVQNEESDS